MSRDRREIASYTFDSKTVELWQDFEADVVQVVAYNRGTGKVHVKTWEWTEENEIRAVRAYNAACRKARKGGVCWYRD